MSTSSPNTCRRLSLSRTAGRCGMLLAGWLLLVQPAWAVHFGRPLSPEEFNTVGRVETNKGYGTGTLITPNLVLTAAHVVEEASSPLEVRFGLQKGNDWEYRQAVAYRIHPEYCTTTDSETDIMTVVANDIAVIYLESPFDASLNYPKLSPADPQPEQEVTIIGVGDTERKNHNPEKKRHAGILRYLGPEQNVRMFGTPKGKPFQRSDHGDSGGPLLMERPDGWHIVATVQGYSTLSTTWGAADEAGMYVSVARHVDWILNTSRQLQEYPTARPRYYVIRPNGAYIEPAISFDELLALIEVKSPGEHWVKYLATRGTSTPVPLKFLEILIEIEPEWKERVLVAVPPEQTEKK